MGHHNSKRTSSIIEMTSLKSEKHKNKNNNNNNNINNNQENKVVEYVPIYKWEREGYNIINGNKSKFNKHENTVLKFLLQIQMPLPMRKKYWLCASGANQEIKSNPNYYHNIVYNFPDYIPSSYDSQIIVDLKRTYPQEPYFQLQSTWDKLHRVLLAYSRRNTSIGYCQGFNFIVGRWLEITEGNEEETFWIFTQVIEVILPVEHYSELSGIMSDCGIIWNFVKMQWSEIYNHWAEIGFEMCLNNILYKWFVSLFIENMSRDIFIPIWDWLFLEGNIILFRAAVAILYLLKDKILSFSTMLEVNTFFEDEIRSFKSDKFLNLLINEKFQFNMDYINLKRKEALPKVIENIHWMNNQKSKKQNTNSLECNLDWPVCLSDTNEWKVTNYSVYKIINKPHFEDDFYVTNKNVFEIVQTQERINKAKQEKRAKNENAINNKILIFGDLLIERHVHKCKSTLSTRMELLNNTSRNKFSPLSNSILMNNDHQSRVSDIFSSFWEEKKSIEYSKIIDNVDKIISQNTDSNESSWINTKINMSEDEEK